MSSTMVFITQTSMGIIGALLCTEAPGSNFLKNTISNESDGNGINTTLIRFIFLVILLLHTPYIFFNLKENVFVIYDEFSGKLSAQIEAKLVKFYNK